MDELVTCPAAQAQWLVAVTLRATSRWAVVAGARSCDDHTQCRCPGPHGQQTGTHSQKLCLQSLTHQPEALLVQRHLGESMSYSMKNQKFQELGKTASGMAQVFLLP